MATQQAAGEVGFRRALTYFDVTNITVGAIVGADIYVAAAITAGLLGPASLLAWTLAALLAATLALTLAQCAARVPQVGGPYAYVSRALGRFPGFLAGWSMWIAELTAMPVFAIAFTSYLGYFTRLSHFETHALRITFIVVLTAVNVVSVKAAGRFNDALTGLKLAPLLLLVAGGLVYAVLHPGFVHGNLSPFAPFGLHHLPSALVLVVWAYMGFELSTVPSGEVKDPERTIPRALATGMAIVAAFYLSTNFVLYALVPHGQLALSSRPLALAGSVVFGSAGAAILSAGAIVSVSGSDESDMLGSSRLAYAMAADGLLPHPLASVHTRFGTPHVALIAQAGIAVALTFVDKIARLISFAVFNLAFSFLLCGVALWLLQARDDRRASLGERLLAITGIGVAAGLLLATSTSDKLEALAVLMIGVAVYLVTAPRQSLPQVLRDLTAREHVLATLARRRMRFLGGLIGWLGGHRTPG